MPRRSTHLPAAERDVWDPDRYARFADERRAPFLDLLALVEPRSAMRVVDLGCGTGELTRLAHERLRARETVGVDASAAMLARAATHAGGGLAFRQGDLAAVDDGPYDLVLSNAALHWIPDHEALLPRLAALLAPGGQLALQIPANEEHPSHAIARAVAREPDLAASLGGFVRESPVLAPEAYAQLLWRLGLEARRVRVEIYGHPLPEPGAVVDWVRGTLLTDYERRLPPEAYARFLERYRARLLEALGDARPFLYTYRRVFLWARRSAAP
ncbi:methyltransferase domain-containing protein [Anaeromyxobacter sp. SG64]|uniref:methyltransferase domain-containing protein n=1 Tax=Anaeromyxobacter sp. SG64 TaxID=2925409 RepID=UPI001F5A8646|nr:methyltransferase domain-containing protein [Anaeromyxobacter sp. SG64]